MEEPPLQQPQPNQKEKKGFWGGLLRRASLGGKKKPVRKVMITKPDDVVVRGEGKGVC